MIRDEIFMSDLDFIIKQTPVAIDRCWVSFHKSFKPIIVVRFGIFIEFFT